MPKRILIFFNNEGNVKRDSSCRTVMSNVNNDGDIDDNGKNTSKNKRNDHALSHAQTQKRKFRNLLMRFYIVTMFVFISENLTFRHNNKKCC